MKRCQACGQPMPQREADPHSPERNLVEAMVDPIRLKAPQTWRATHEYPGVVAWTCDEEPGYVVYATPGWDGQPRNVVSMQATHADDTFEAEDVTLREPVPEGLGPSGPGVDEVDPYREYRAAVATFISQAYRLEWWGEGDLGEDATLCGKG